MFSTTTCEKTMSSTSSSVSSAPSYLAHCCGVTVSGPGRISSRGDGTVAWTSGSFITVQERPDFGHLTQFQTKRVVCCLAVSPGGKLIASGEAGKDPCVRVYNREQEKYTSKLKGHSFEIVCVEWHQNGRLLVSCGNVHDRQIIIWDTKKNVQVAYSRLNMEPKAMGFYHKSLITLGKGHIRYWTVPEMMSSNATKSLIGRNVALKNRRNSAFNDMTTTASALFIVSPDGIGKLTTTRTLQSWCDIAGTNCITSLQDLLLVGVKDEDDARVLIMTENFVQLKCFQPEQNVPPTPVACQPFDQSHIVIVYEDRSCSLMQIDQNNDPILVDELGAINGHVSAMVATSPTSIITGSQDCTFRGWELQDGQFLGEFNLLTEAPIKCVSINETHDLIAVGLANGNVCLYTVDMEDGWSFHSCIECHNAEVLCLSWNKNLLATGGRDRFVHVIDIDPDNRREPTRSTIPLKMHTSIVTAVHWMVNEHDNTARLITGGIDKALYFMMATSEKTEYEREKWIQANCQIYDIKGRLNVYVAMGKLIRSYNINGDLLKEFTFDKTTKVTSIALNESESIVAGCSTNAVCMFDTSTGSIIQTINVSCLSLALIGDYIITGDVEGTLACWQQRGTGPNQDQSKTRQTLSRQSSLPMPAPKIRRDTMPPAAFNSDLNSTKERRRTAWGACPTPFKIKSTLDTSAVTIFDEDDEDEPIDETDFETCSTVRENSSFDFDANDDTVKEADGSSASSGVGSSSAQTSNDTELTDLEKDDTKKSSNFDDDSLNASIDDADALFGDCKDDGDDKLATVFGTNGDYGRASLSSHAMKRISDQSKPPSTYTPSLSSPTIPEEETTAFDQRSNIEQTMFDAIAMLKDDTKLSIKEKLDLAFRINISLNQLTSEIVAQSQL